MKILYQCMGITGLIMMFYGLLAFAVTQDTQSVVFWGLLGVGTFLVGLFVTMILSRRWQMAIVAFVVCNVPWVLCVAGKNWPGLEKIADKEWYGYVVLGVAVLFNAAFVYFGRLWLRDLFEKRSMRYGTNAAVYTAITVAIVAVLNVAGQDFHARYDWTENQVNSLSDQSIKLLEGLKEKVQILAFFDEHSQPQQEAKGLLDSYTARSKKLEVRFLDPDRDRTVAMEHNAKEGDVVVLAGDQSNITRELTEQGITQAISKVTRTETPKVCFTKGHGELDLAAPDDNPRSLSGAKGGMENEGYEPQALESIAGEVPSDCAMLVIAGPTAAFTTVEAEAVGRYLDAGGKALVMLDPNFPDPRLQSAELSIPESGLEGVLAKWGVEIGKAAILEKRLELFRGVQIGLTVSAQSYGSHPIVDALKGQQTVFQNVRPVHASPGGKVDVKELVSSAGDDLSWAEADLTRLLRDHKATLDPTDIKGPVPFAVAVESSTPATKLVVIGDSDFISNGMVRSYGFNFDLFMNTINWLQGEGAKISIRPKTLRTSAIELTAEQANAIFYVAMVGIPMLVLIFGMDLWWIRRRRG